MSLQSFIALVLGASITKHFSTSLTWQSNKLEQLANAKILRVLVSKAIIIQSHKIFLCDGL